MCWENALVVIDEDNRQIAIAMGGYGLSDPLKLSYNAERLSEHIVVTHDLVLRCQSRVAAA